MISTRVQLLHKAVGRYSLIKMEQEAVQNVLDQSPESKAKSEVAGHRRNTAKALERDIDTVRDGRPPNKRNQPPRRLGQRLKEVAKQRRRLSSLVVARTVDLVKVELFGEATVPNLHKQRLVQVEELVCLVVGVVVGVLAEVLFAGHTRPRMNPRLFFSALAAICLSVRQSAVS